MGIEYVSWRSPMIGISFPSFVATFVWCPGRYRWIFNSSSVLGSDTGPSLYEEAWLILISPFSTNGFMNWDSPNLNKMSQEFGPRERMGAVNFPLGNGCGRGSGSFLKKNSYRVWCSFRYQYQELRPLLIGIIWRSGRTKMQKFLWIYRYLCSSMSSPRFLR